MNDIFVCDLNALADLIADKLMKRLDAFAPQQQDVYTIQQLAERYHVSEDSIRRRINAGEFGAPHSLWGRTWPSRFRRSCPEVRREPLKAEGIYFSEAQNYPLGCWEALIT